MRKPIVLIAALLASWAFAYWLGTTKAEIKYITKEKEVIKYEKTCATDILAKPNLADDAIVQLLDAGKL
ncbi:MAG: hypothetical protein V8R23_00670 [Alphaproteobacteria bacterium]